MRSLVVTVAAIVAFAIVGCECSGPRPEPLKHCNEAGVGCLSDEICVDLLCIPRPRCETNDDCPSPAEECVLPAQVCELRVDFGQECNEPDAPCEDANQFCALGLCRDRVELFCLLSEECDVGEKCDPVHFYCIPDGPCTLADEFPELACTGQDVCDVLSDRCIRPCQFECEDDEDCAAGQLCNGSCECKDCNLDEDCGPGLVCSRQGSCVSENLCREDEDCDPPLICDVGGTQLCQVAPPACFSDFDCAIVEVCDLATGRCVLPDEFECDRDPLEESDTPSAATVVEFEPGGVYDKPALSLCPDDDDVFAVPLLAGQAIIAEVTGTVGAARASIWLLDSAAETSLEVSEMPPRGAGRIEYTAQVDETVYLRLNAITAPTDYDIVIELIGGEVCQPDFFEGGGGNNSIATATSPDLVPNGVDMAGEICPEDFDFYRLDVLPGEAIEARLTFDEAVADLDVALLDQFGNVAAQSAGLGQPEVTRRRFAGGGTVYVRVRGFGNDIAPYTLRITRTAPFQCSDDVAEPRTMCEGDVDFVNVALEDFERLVIITDYDDADVELEIDVLDETGATILATSPSSTGGAALSYDAQANENVVVRVRSLGNTIGAYTLSVLRENQLDCAPDVREPNNTVATAQDLLAASGQLLTICESDADFFFIDAQDVAGKELIVDAFFRQAEGDIDLMLLGLDGTQVLAVADGTSNNEHLEFVLPVDVEDARYTLRVFSLTSGARARYRLQAELVTP